MVIRARDLEHVPKKEDFVLIIYGNVHYIERMDISTTSIVAFDQRGTLNFDWRMALRMEYFPLSHKEFNEQYPEYLI